MRITAYLKLYGRHTIEINVSVAKDLVREAYGGGLEKEKIQELNDLKHVAVLPSHPMSAAYGEVWLEVP